MPKPAPPSYRQAYADLSRIVTELEGGDADLDRILPLLEEARPAYEVCQERVQAVTAAVQHAEWLQQSLAGESGEEE